MIKVVLVEPEIAENIGFIARLISNFNIDGLVLVSPKTSLEKAYVTAVNAKDVLDNAEIYDNFDEAIEGYDLVVGTSAKTASQYNVNRAFIYPWELKVAPKTALVFGRESTGLKNEELEKCDIFLHIPTSDKYRALNLSHAVAIVLYELYKTKEPIKRNIAPKAVREQIYRFWRQILDKLGYERRKAEIQHLLFRRVLERAYMNDREAFGIVGVLSKIVKKI